MKRAFTSIVILAVSLMTVVELLLGNIGYERNSHLLSNAYAGINRVDSISFADLRVVTENGKGCEVPVRDIYHKDCYWHTSPTNIPTLFIHLSRLFGIGSQNTTVVGIVLGTCVVATSIVIFIKTLGTEYAAILSVVFFLSHPTRYALERGNIDMIIYILIIIFAASASHLLTPTSGNPDSSMKPIISGSIRNFYVRRRFEINSIVMATSLLAAVMGKVYPILLFPVIVFIYYSSHARKTLADQDEDYVNKINLFRIHSISLIACACIAVSFLYILTDIAHMLSSSATGTNAGLLFGLKTLPDTGTSEKLQYTIKLFLLGLGVFKGFSRGSQISAKPAYFKDLATSFSDYSLMLFASRRYWDTFCVTLFICGSFLFFGSYIAFANGNYRLFMFIGFLSPLLLRFFRHQKQSVQMSLHTDIQRRSPAPAGSIEALAPFIAIIIIATFNYRPYIPGLQHTTSIFWDALLLPSFIGLVFGSALSIAWKSIKCPF